MINKKLHIILIIILFIPNLIFGQNTLDNTGGKINNLGTIRVKNGQTKALPDTLGGRIEFLQKRSTSQQVIPNIVYNQLYIANTALKLISDERKDGNIVRSIVVLDSLIMADSADFSSNWIGLNSEEVKVKSTVKNTAKYSSGKDMVFSGEEKAQDLLGNGSFSRIRIENPLGVDVRDGGGFKIEQLLTLKQGELRNTKENNFVMLDTSRIVRHIGSSIASQPQLEKQISVHYTGTGDITTGPEIPIEDKALKNLYVNVSGEMKLDRNVSVTDTLQVGSMINASDDTLTLHGALNPQFSANTEIEIMGNFRRNTLLTGDTILLNSPFIWAYFRNDASKGNLKNIISTVRPRKFHDLPFADVKVKRSYTLLGLDESGTKVINGFEMDFGFAWRHKPDNNLNESNGLTPAELVLQRWLDDQWVDIQPKAPPSVDFGTGWATGMVEKLSEFGNFALGMPGGGFLAYIFKASFFLEGPYIAGSQGRMTHDLWTNNMFAQADLTAYPTNIDTKLTPEFLTHIPDSVVDIVVIEFRKERNSPPEFVKTGFLRYDGTLVDGQGKNEIKIDAADGIAAQGGKYHIAVRHRNHAAVITDLPVDISRSTKDTVYHLSDPSMVEGGAASLKLVYTDTDGKMIYALKGGFLADDSDGLNNQLNFLKFYTRNYEHQAAFGGFTRTGYINTDFNLSGIINTKDFNITWNNRGQD